MRVGGAASTIVECNWAGSKTRQTARRPRGYSGPFEGSPFIFVTERGSPFTVSGLQKMIERVGIEAKFEFKVHPHMLRHSTGYALANKGVDTRTLQGYLGHRSIQSTVRYTELAPGRFKNIWR
jgi:site-specific recombinase XerD